MAFAYLRRYHFGRLVAPITVLVATAVFLHYAVRIWHFTIEDAYITFRYARNLAQGLELTWNPGQRVEGFTSFLHVLLLAIGYRWADVETLAKALGVGSTLALMAGLLVGAGRLVGCYQAGAVAAALFVVTPITVVHAVAGLETSLFAFGVVVVLLQASRLVTQTGSQQEKAVDLLLVTGGGLGLVRPEGFLVLGVTLLAAFAWNGEVRKRLLCHRRVALVSIGLAAYFLARFAYFGSLLPNSFYVKSGNVFYLEHSLFKPAGLAYVRDFLALLNWPWLVPFAVKALLIITRRARISFLEVVALSVGAAIITLYLFFYPIMGYYYRFLIPAYAALIVALLPTIKEIGQYSGGWFIRLALGAILAYPLLSAEPLSRVARYADEYSVGIYNSNARIGKILGSLERKGKLLVIEEAGAIPFFSDWITIDGSGLNDKRIAFRGFDTEYIFQFDPDVIVLSSLRSDKLVFRQDTTTLVSDGRFEDRYQFAAAFSFFNRFWEFVYVRKSEPQIARAFTAQATSLWSLYSSRSSEQQLKLLADNMNFCFPSDDVEPGEFVGVRKFLSVNSPSLISLEVYDNYSGAHYPGRFQQRVYIDGRMVWFHDISSDEVVGWIPLTYETRPSNKEVEIRVEVVAIGQSEKGWSWGSAVSTKVRNVQVMPLRQ